jgi:tRNA acetyltransferase TAN1
MSSESKPKDSGNKRKYHDRSGRKWVKNPKRGGPGVLLTCETGRDPKCRREGLDILNHYVSNDKISDKEEDSSSLSLEEELKVLKAKKRDSGFSNFGVYDVGIRGNVVVLCTMPDCNLIPPIQVEKDLSSDKKTKDDSGDDEEENEQPEAKKPRKDADEDIAEEKSETEQKEETTVPPEGGAVVSDPPWDPISTVRRIMTDLEQNSSKAPSSRFVTRMIPMQATCFASAEELQLTSKALLDKYLPRTTKTFAVAARKRNCGNLKTNQIIETVATLVFESIPECKVKLENPDVTIVVEVCKTLCGVSVVPRCDEFRNFNLVMAREENKEDKEEDKKENK